MIVAPHTVLASLDTDSGTLDLDVIDAEVELDDAWSPYVVATLTVATPDTADLIDPRQAPRLLLTLTDGATARDLDLVLFERAIDHELHTTTLRAASDEKLLQDHALVDEEASTAARAHETSLRTIIDQVVLPAIDAELDVGTADYDATIDYNATNLIPNPSAETNLTGWSSASGDPLARSAAVAKSGTWSISITSPAARAGQGPFGSNSTYPPFTIPVTPGKTYTFSCWAYSTQPGKEATARIRWGSGSSVLGADVWGEVKTPPVNQWVYLEVTATAPPGATHIAPWAVINGGWTTGQTCYFDAFLLTEGTDHPPYFDGATPPSTMFEYAWKGTAHGSASARTGKLRRSPDSLTWEPGRTAWDFIVPLVQASGLRLYCDEARRWRLVDATDLTPGQINTTAGVNLTRASDQISRNDAWYDSVVIEYRWLEGGAQWVRYDTAGEGDRCLTLTYNRPYPGPGAAQAVLRRSQGRGRVLDLEALSTYHATPGQALQVTLPGTPLQTGVISRVTWRAPAGLMTLASRGLTDTPPTAWVLLDEADRWLDSPIGESWIEEVA